MISIPDQINRKFSQPNTSDLFGNIFYTKNMNFSEKGYAKLSSRAVSFDSEKDDSSFDIPVSLGRQTGIFHLVTTDSPYDLSLVVTDLSIAEDTSSNNPTLTFDSWGKWFQNRWHATTATKMWYETATGSGWTDTGISLTTGKVHPIEVFRNRNAICVGDGNLVKIYDTSYSLLATLTLPADYEVIGLSYANNRMGIVTMLSDTVAGQNQEAFFFTWDGANSSASIGLPVGSDIAAAIAVYKSSWVILTRVGELKYFNGGGFETLGVLPFFNQQITWGDPSNRQLFGDVLSVSGDLIFINLGNSFSIFGKNGESFLPQNPAGVWCYDPTVGLHHRYSPSISPAYFIKVLSAGINITTDIITRNSGTIPPTGSPIKQVYDSTNPVGGVMVSKVYYVIRHTSTTFSLALTKQNAIDGVKLDITSANDCNFVAINVLDYGASIVNRAGGIGQVDVRRETADHLVFGGELRDFNSSTDYATLCITMPRFENRGYLITAKILSLNVEDELKKVYLKHRALVDNDRIILKYKKIDKSEIPTSTPQFNNVTICTYTSSTILTTTADLSMIVDYLAADPKNECEVEIISGAGAGQMAQIASLTLNAGIYTVTLTEAIDGATAGYTCDILIDNWKLLKTTKNESYISSVNSKGWEEFSVATSSKWGLFKIEVRGDETTLEEFQSVNDPQIKTI